MEKTLCFIINNKKLYLEQNVVSLDVPLLFICKDQEENRYIVLYTDSNELHYLVAEITTNCLLALLKSEITLREPFCQSKFMWKIISGSNILEDQVIPIQYSQIPDIDLPKKGAYLDYSNKELVSYQTSLELNKSQISLSILGQKIKSITLYHKKHIFKCEKKHVDNLNDFISSINIPFKHEFNKTKGEKLIWPN